MVVHAMIALLVLALALTIGGALYSWIKGNREDPW